MIKITKDTSNRFPSETKLDYYIFPTDSSNQLVTWSQDNENIATVDPTGLIKAVAIGTCNITVTTDDGQHSDSCQITVNTTPSNSKTPTIFGYVDKYFENVEYKLNVSLPNGDLYDGPVIWQVEDTDGITLLPITTIGTYNGLIVSSFDDTNHIIKFTCSSTENIKLHIQYGTTTNILDLKFSALVIDSLRFGGIDNTTTNYVLREDDQSNVIGWTWSNMSNPEFTSLKFKSSIKEQNNIKYTPVNTLNGIISVYEPQIRNVIKLEIDQENPILIGEVNICSIFKNDALNPVSLQLLYPRSDTEMTIGAYEYIMCQFMPSTTNQTAYTFTITDQSSSNPPNQPVFELVHFEEDPLLVFVPVALGTGILNITSNYMNSEGNYLTTNILMNVVNEAEPEVPEE